MKNAIKAFKRDMKTVLDCYDNLSSKDQKIFNYIRYKKNASDQIKTVLILNICAWINFFMIVHTNHLLFNILAAIGVTFCIKKMFQITPEAIATYAMSLYMKNNFEVNRQ